MQSFMVYSQDKEHVWEAYNIRLEVAIGNKDWFGLGTIYYEMAAFVEKEGRDSAYLKEKGFEAKLRFHESYIERETLVNKFEVLSNKGCCSTCSKLLDRTYTREELRESVVLPVKACQNDDYGCRCLYLPVID